MHRLTEHFESTADEATRELYARYVKYIDESAASIMPLMPSARSRKYLRDAHVPLTLEAFASAIDPARIGPTQRQRIERLIGEGFFGSADAA